MDVFHTVFYVQKLLSPTQRSMLLFQEAKTRSDGAKTQASKYLAERMREITDPFQMSITAYALQRANHRDKDNAFARLRDMKRAGKISFCAVSFLKCCFTYAYYNLAKD